MKNKSKKKERKGFKRWHIREGKVHSYGMKSYARLDRYNDNLVIGNIVLFNIRKQRNIIMNKNNDIHKEISRQ